MPRRNNMMRVASDEVQGEGSFVLLRRIRWETQQEAQLKLAEAAGGEIASDGQGVRVTTEFLQINADFTRDLLRQCVVDWNWVDDDEKALPKPSDPAALGMLNVDEVQFIVRALQPGRDELKN